MPRVSIIIPVYKAERYLKKCIDSILAQTFFDFELILIDDGSPDSSPAICDGYTQKDSRVRVIHQENSGVSSARNVGISCAQGDYIVFVDSDDYLASNYLEMLYEGCRLGVDIAICGYYTVISDQSNHTHIDRTISLAHIGNIKDVFKNIVQSDMLYAPWNKMFKSNILRDNSIRFDESMALGEDLCFNIAYLHYCEKCYISNLPLYFHVKFNSTLSRNIPLNYFDIQKRLYEIIIDFISQKGIKYDLAFNIENLLKDVFGALVIHKVNNKQAVHLKIKEILQDKLVDKYLIEVTEKTLFYYLLRIKSVFLIITYFGIKKLVGEFLRGTRFNYE